MVTHHMGHNENSSSVFYLYNTNIACRRLTIHLAVLFTISFFYVNSAYAGVVTFTPSISLKESYSDNILLAPKGQEESETVTEISPAFTLLMRGSKFNASVNYTMQNLLYKKKNNRNETYNQLSAASTSELVDNFFYFDVNADHTQQIINADEPVGNNNIAVTNNTSNVSSYSLVPYFRHSFRDAFDMLVRYSYSEVDYRRDDLVDTTQTGSDVELNSPTNTTGFSWGLNYLQQKSDYETGSDSEFKRGSLQLGYRFTSRTHIYASKGKDENTFTVSNNQDISEPFWNAGIDWQPGSRDFLTLQYGERFFGHTTQFSWRHSARRFSLNANYEEELSTSASSLLQSQQIGSTASQQNQPVDANNSVNSQVFVRELGTVGLTYTVSKTTLSLNYSNEKRKFQSTGDITQAKIANLSVNLRSSPVLTYIFGTTWRSNYTASTDIKSFNTNLNFTIQRQLAPSFQAEFFLSHGIRRSINAVTDYDENIISLGLTKTFN